MHKNTLSQKLIPFITLLFICFILFGPISIPYAGTILCCLVIFIASYIEYKVNWISSLGLKGSNFKFKNFFVFAPLIAFGMFLLYLFVLIPVVTKITGSPMDFSEFKALEGDWLSCLIFLPFIWISAGFGEEIVFRGYFMKQFVKLFGDAKVSIVTNIILFACFFGYLHGYQGISGQIITGIIGGIIATIFYLRKYDLWFVVAIHGFFDTFALFCVYFGLL